MGKHAYCGTDEEFPFPAWYTPMHYAARPCSFFLCASYLRPTDCGCKNAYSELREKSGPARTINDLADGGMSG